MIVKDVLYGNIELSGIYEKIVNCSEFSRLKDITQTAMSALKYPELANETRYEHSIGTYYLMCRTINEIEKNLSAQGVFIDKQEKIVAKIAALLHDIGHGVNSHMLEKISKMSHEARSISIVKDQNTEIHKIIVEEYGEDFVGKLADFMECVYGDKEITEKTEIQSDNVIPIKHLLATLISHNIDVDRMDYLARESTYTGIGKLMDYNKIISSFECTVVGNQVLVAIPEDKMHYIETLIFERTRNYREIYFCDTDMLSEHLFEQLIEELRSNPAEVPEDIPESIRKFLTMETAELDNEEYMQLTNKNFVPALETIKQTTQNEKIRYLCDYAERAKTDYQILPSNIDETYLRRIFKKVIPNFPEDSHSICKRSKTVKPYKKTKYGSTNIITNQGIKQFEELPHAVSLEPISKKVVAFNQELLRLEMGLSKEEFDAKYGEIVKDLIESQTRIPQEFEKKYMISGNSKISYKEVVDALQKKYQMVDSAKYYSLDTYYDTEGLDLLHGGQTLRIREGNKYYKGKLEQQYKNRRITYKSRVNDNQQDFITKNKVEEFGNSIELSDYSSFLQENNIPTNLKKMMIVNNNRKLVTFLINGEKIDISFNVAEYENYVSKQKGMFTTIEIRTRENQIKGRLGIIALKQALEDLFPKLKSMTSHQDVYKIGMEQVDRLRKFEHEQEEK